MNRTSSRYELLNSGKLHKTSLGKTFSRNPTKFSNKFEQIFLAKNTTEIPRRTLSDSNEKFSDISSKSSLAFHCKIVWNFPWKFSRVSSVKYSEFPRAICYNFSGKSSEFSWKIHHNFRDISTAILFCIFPENYLEFSR